MTISPRWRPAGLLAVAVACAGCDQSLPGAASQQAPAHARDDPAPTAEPRKPLVEVTPRAVKSVLEIVESQSVAGNWALRLDASWPSGVCSPQHRLDIETKLASSEDYAFDSGGLRLIVLKRQVELFRGAQIDYGEKDGRQGFLVNNPNFEGELLKKWGPIVADDPLSRRK